jgi:hypothetical protein
MQGILPSYKAKNFSDLALLAMQHYRRAAQLEAGNPPRNGAVRDFEEINAFCSWRAQWRPSCTSRTITLRPFLEATPFQRQWRKERPSADGSSSTSIAIAITMM